MDQLEENRASVSRRIRERLQEDDIFAVFCENTDGILKIFGDTNHNPCTYKEAVEECRKAADMGFKSMRIVALITVSEAKRKVDVELNAV